MDFQSMFAMDPFALLELFIRGTCMYWFLFVAFRFVLPRDVGGMGVADVLLLVLIADAAQNAMAADYKSIPEGIVLVSTILGWNYLLDWLAFHVPSLARLINLPTLLLVRDGRIVRRNLASQFLTEEELMSQLREQGIDDLKQVSRAFMESDGHVSVIRNEPAAGRPKRAENPVKGR